MQTAFVRFVAFCSKLPGIIGSVLRQTVTDPAPVTPGLQPRRLVAVRSAWLAVIELQFSCSSNQFVESTSKKDHVFQSGDKYIFTITLVLKLFIRVYKMLPDPQVITLSANMGRRYSSAHRTRVRVGAIRQ